MTNINMIQAKNGKPCLIDYDGNIWLEPKVDVDTMYYPSNGLAVVGKNGKYGYINKYGVLVIPMKYKEAGPFAENGLAFVVCENGLGGYIDEEGRFVIDPIYDTGSLFRFGMAAVSKNDEYIFIYKNGSKAINNTFKYASGFSECGLAKVVEFNGKHALMDTTSLVVLSLKSGCELDEFQDGTRLTTFRKDGREALINSAGQIITGFYDKIIISPYNRLSPFLRNGLWGYLDPNGSEVIPNIYKEASVFEEYKQYKIAAVKSYHPLAENNVVHLYINEQDEIIENNLIEEMKQHLNEEYTKVNRFRAQLALAVKKEGEKVKTTIQGGVKHMRDNEHDEYKENEQTEKDESTYHDEYNEIDNDQHDNDHTVSEQDVYDHRHDDINDEQLEDINKRKMSEEDHEEMEAYSEEGETDDAETDKDAKYYEQFRDGMEMGRLYEVRIYFRNMPLRQKIYEFLMDNLGAGIMLLEIKVNYARLMWPILDWEDPADIENAMYYLLDDVRLGEYDYSYIDSYYDTTKER